MSEHESDNEIVARVDERTKAIQNDIVQIEANIKENRNTFANNISEVWTVINRDFVKRTEFTPIKLVVYGFIGMILTSVVAAIIATVVHSVPK